MFTKKIPKLHMDDKTQSNKKQWWQIPAAVAGGLISGLFSSAAQDDANAMNWNVAKLNYDAQMKTNEANRQMVKETNETNVDLQGAMNAFNERMWEKNNEYNSPVQQMARAQDAGINPNVVFGQPVASSPVQQTSIPAQSVSRDDAPRLNMNPSSKGFYKFLEKLGDTLANLPFNKERLENMRLSNKKQEIDNELAQYDVWEKENEKKMFENFGAFRSLDGSRLVSPEEYSALSDEEKKAFIKPNGYRNVVSDKVISDYDYNHLPENQKKLYEPNYKGISSQLPTLEKMPFKSKQQFEDWKSLYSFGNTLANIRADRLQNVIREKVLSSKLQDNDTLNALAKMDKMTFDKLAAEYKKTLEDVKALKARNVNVSERLRNDDRIAQYTADILENKLNNNVIGQIKKYLPEGGFRDFLMSAYILFKDLAD